MTQEEIVHVPPIIQQARIHQQQGQMSVEEVVPMTQEEIGCMYVHSCNGAPDARIDLVHSSAWGDWALYDTSPLRTIENDLGVQTMDGPFDPVGFAEVPVPMTQEENVHAPTIIQQDRIPQQQVEIPVVVPVPMTQEESVHGPTISQQERIQQQHVEMVVEVPIPMTQEVIAHVPTIIIRHCHHLTEDEMTVDVPAPQTQEEIAQHKKPIIQEEITHVPKIMEQIVLCSISSRSTWTCRRCRSSTRSARCRCRSRCKCS